MSHARDVVYKSEIVGVAVHSCALPEGVGCGPMENHNTIGFLSDILVRSPLNLAKLPNQHLMLCHNRPASETPFQWQNRYRADNSPLSRQTFLDPRMTFQEKFLLQYKGTFDIPTYKYQLLQKIAYAKLIQMVIVLSKGNIGL